MVYVYAIRAKAGAIKIGCAKNPHARRVELQGGADSELELVGVQRFAGRADALRAEAAIHAKFTHLRRSGEWFDSAPDLLAYLQDPMWQSPDTVARPKDWRQPVPIDAALYIRVRAAADSAGVPVSRWVAQAITAGLDAGLAKPTIPPPPPGLVKAMRDWLAQVDKASTKPPATGGFVTHNDLPVHRRLGPIPPVDPELAKALADANPAVEPIEIPDWAQD